MSNSAQTSASSRIASLLDENSFVEVGAYITARNTDFNMAEQETPADGVITGYGTIGGCLVYVYSQDASVLGGSMGEMHAKKICSIYSMAMKMGAPVIGLVDCAGLRLQEATDALDGFGKLYLSQAMASGVIPQIMAVFGTCGGGMAVAAGMADFTFMEEKSAQLFVNAPNALEGNYKAKCDTAAAAFQSKESGVVDFTGDEASILSQIRTLVSILPANNEEDLSEEDCQDDLNRMCSGIEGLAGDPIQVLSMISDNHFVMEVKKDYEPSMVTAFIRLNGVTVGCVANRTERYEDGKKADEFEAALSGKGCDKAVELISFCDAFSIPLLTLTNVNGYKAKMCSERRIARAAARLTYAYADATVPKVTVVTGKALGSAGLTMGSKSLGTDLVYAWPNAVIGTMEPEAAVKIMYAKEIEASDDAVALISEKTAEYTKTQSGAVAAARRGYADDIIKAEETRQRLAAAFDMLYTKSDGPSFKEAWHGLKRGDMYMRRLFKRMAAAVLVSACLVSLSACSKTEEETESLSISMDGTPVEDAMGQSLLLSAAQTLGASDEQLVVQGKLAQSQGDTVSAELYQAQLDVREEMGALRSVDIEDGSVVLLEDGSYTVILPVEFAEGTKKYVMNLNMATQQIQAQFTDMSAGVEEDSSIGGLLRTASVYTLIGLGTVFCVLVFISLLISCFKFIHAWEEGQKNKAADKKAEPAKAPVPAVSAAPAVSALQTTGPELADDAELVAVMAAAIAAYEGTSPNGLVVRSIRRVSSSRRR